MFLFELSGWVVVGDGEHDEGGKGVYILNLAKPVECAETSHGERNPFWDDVVECNFDLLPELYDVMLPRQ